MQMPVRKLQDTIEKPCGKLRGRVKISPVLLLAYAIYESDEAARQGMHDQDVSSSAG
jgi:hypothetical protein